MSINSIKFDHIGFAVKDIKQAVKWYSEVLGFSKLLAPGITEMDLMGHKGFRCMIANSNNMCLELEQRTDIKFPANESPLISHFSINVSDIKSTKDYLENQPNVELDNAGSIVNKPGKKILYMTGLDGIRIEIIEHITN